MTPAPRYIGIDVAKARLDVAARPSGEAWSATNDAAGIAALVARLHELQPALVVLEATGGGERPLTAALAGAGLPVAVVNPRQARDFATATGQLAKTDALDAHALAHFAEAVRPAARPVPEAQAQAWAAVLARRRQLVEMLTAAQHRLHTAAAPVRERSAAHIAWLEEELDDTNQELDRLVAEDPAWRERDALLRGVPGVGPVLSTTLLAELPELGALTRHEVAALAGVAPLNRDSGTRRGNRAVWGGRAQLRATLYMGTLAAARCTPLIKACDERLCAAGKPKKVALTACMRKLLTIRNALLRHGTPWRLPAAPAVRYGASARPLRAGGGAGPAGPAATPASATDRRAVWATPQRLWPPRPRAGWLPLADPLDAPAAQWFRPARSACHIQPSLVQGEATGA